MIFILNRLKFDNNDIIINIINNFIYYKIIKINKINNNLINIHDAIIVNNIKFHDIILNKYFI